MVSQVQCQEFFYKNWHIYLNVYPIFFKVKQAEMREENMDNADST